MEALEPIPASTAPQHLLAITETTRDDSGLLPDEAAAALVDFDEEITMVIDVPPMIIPPTTPAAISVAAAPTTPHTAPPQNDIVATCGPVGSTPLDQKPEYEMGGGASLGGVYRDMLPLLGFTYDKTKGGYYSASGEKHPLGQKTVQVLVKPKLGRLDGSVEYYYSYWGKTGQDKAVLLVTEMGKKFRVTITFNLKADPMIMDTAPCKIIKAPAPGAAASWFNPDHSNFTVSFSDIPGQSLGTTVGTTVGTTTGTKQ